MSEKNSPSHTGGAAQSSASTGSTHSLLQSTKKVSGKHLQTVLQKFFASIDDSLFENSEKAESEEKKALYFDAMRDIRKDKKDAAQIFFTTFEKTFNDCLNGTNAYVASASQDNSETEEFSFASLSLVEDDDLEESLAISNMIDKAHGLYREDLLAIGQRYNEIVPGAELDSENNPISPEHICHAFEEMMEKLSLEIDIRLIVYKLFEKHVISNLAGLYEDVNSLFIKAGVLPTIKFKSPVKAKQQAVTEPKAQENEVVAMDSMQAAQVPQEKAQQQEQQPAPKVSVDEASFDSLRSLLAHHRGAPPPGKNAGQGSGSGASGGPGGGAGAGGDGGDGGNYVSQDVLSGLSQLQTSFAISNAAAIDLNSIADIKQQLLETINSLKGAAGEGLGGDDSDAIDIVSMMFEFILEDKTLSDRFRAEIARLQIPIIKVAILDKTFFAEQDHAARLLLNELAYAGSATDDDTVNSDALFEKVEYVVNTVIAEFQSNIDIFDQLLKEFRTYVAKDSNTNKKSEEKLSSTKKSVSDTIAKRLKKASLPDTINDLVVRYWKDVLTTIGMKQGCGSNQWRAAVDVVDDLIWSVQPKLMPSEKQDLTRLIPKIVKNLRQGLNLIGLDQETISRLLADLQKIHLDCLKGTSERNVETSDEDLASILDADIEKALNPGAKKDENPFETDFGDVEYFDSGSDDFSMIELPPKVMRSKHLELVRNMELATWVEFRDDKKAKRGKLSWRCDFTGDFTFVDRRYRLVADISMAELVTRFDEGTASIVKDVPLLDRALDAVISSMSKMKNDGSGTTQLSDPA